jgi:putative DNA primase/helicase
MESHSKASSIELAREFVESTEFNGFPTIRYWRNDWYRWNGVYYRHVNREAIEHDILTFLEARPTTRVSRSAIRGTLDFLRILQFCGKETPSCWLDGRTDPCPKEVFFLKNGALHVPSMRLVRHDPAFFNLSSADYDFSKRARCPCWHRFLNEVWPGDRRGAELLQEWFGYCLLPDTSLQKILNINGPSRSGKGTIARVLRALLGRESVACPSIRSLSGQFGLWALLNKSLAIIPDATLPRPCPAVEELLKSISGEDAVDIHRKGMAPLTGVKLPTRIMILANEMPVFDDPSGALDRRLLTLRTVRSFYGQEDVLLTSKLLDELPGILNWALEGRARLYSRGHFECNEPASYSPESIQGLPDLDRIRRIVVEYEPCNGHRKNRRPNRRRQRIRHPR